MESLNSNIRNIWIVTSLIMGSFIGAIISVFSYAAVQSAAVAGLAFVFPPAILAIYSLKRYQNWFFQVNEDYLEINHGVLRKVSAVIPYVRVQHIDTNRGPLERILGLASVRVYTAGSKGADMRIPGLSRERAERMQEDLKNKAIESEHGFDGV